MIEKVDIIDNIYKHQGGFQVPILLSYSQRRLFAKVVRLYLKFMFQSILDGNKWFISRMGSFQLETVQSDPKKLKPFTNFYKDGIIRRNKRHFNPKMPGEIIRLKVISPFLEKEKCRFRPNKTFRIQLAKKLFERGNFLKEQSCP